MEVNGEIERMKELTTLTNRIELLKKEIESLKEGRRALMNNYVNETLISNPLRHTDESG